MAVDTTEAAEEREPTVSKLLLVPLEDIVVFPNMSVTLTGDVHPTTPEIDEASPAIAQGGAIPVFNDADYWVANKSFCGSGATVDFGPFTLQNNQTSTDNFNLFVRSSQPLSFDALKQKGLAEYAAVRRRPA